MKEVTDALRDRYTGALLGLAVGDAVGTAIEFSPPGTFAPITDMLGGGPFHLAPGQWTDDTSMALCLAHSLIECNGFDAADQMRRYVAWWREGYMSSTGKCFDIGNTVGAALDRFIRTGEPYSGSMHPHSAGNGSIMRLAPVPLCFRRDPAEAVRRAADSSRTTHGTLEAVDACRYFAALLIGALQGATKDELLSPRYSPVPALWDDTPLAPRIDDIARGSYRSKEPPQIRGSGYVVESLEAALWAFSRSTTFREGCLLAVNLGNDADTTGAVYGQLAGAHYGAGGIPGEWLERLHQREFITDTAARILELAQR